MIDVEMLTSSAEYLQALRTKNFLRFLEWPEFIVKKYQYGDHAFGNDEIMDLLIFDWLNNGYCEADAKVFALLYAVDNIDNTLIRGKILNALAMFSIAIAKCMAFESTQKRSAILMQESLNPKQITKLMAANEISQGHLEESRGKFLQWVDKIDETTVLAVSQQINKITSLRYVVDQYILELSTIINPDSFKATRASLVVRLFDYLNEQMEFTPAVQETIAEYVKKIWELQPCSFEHAFLNQLMPGGDNTWSFIAKWGQFFSTLELIPAISNSGTKPPATDSPGAKP